MNETEFLAIIRRILLNEWDPIGVGSAPEADDEYDSYAARVISLLEAGHCSPEIAELLADVEQIGMGLDARPIVCRTVAEHIVSEWATRKQKSD